MMKTTEEVLELAKQHLDNGADMASSALSCFNDAQAFLAAGKPDLARRWAVRSLAYSVGIFHAAMVSAVAT